MKSQHPTYSTAVNSNYRRLRPGAMAAADQSDQEWIKMIWVIFTLMAAIGLGTANPLLTSAGFLIPPILLQLLWRGGEPPVLLFAASFQWLQIFAPILSSDFANRTLLETFDGPELEYAEWLSMLGLLVLATGMRMSAFRLKPVPHHVIVDQLRQLSPDRLPTSYVVCFLLSGVIEIASNRIRSLQQPLWALTSIHWVPVILILWRSAQLRSNYQMMVCLVLFEIVVGFTGFFSTFKSILFLLVVVQAGVRTSRGIASTGAIGISMLLLLFLVAFWQAIKDEYRVFVSRGTASQTVSVPISDRLAYLAQSSSEVTPEKLGKGLVTGINRLGYVSFFAHSIRHVPQNIPYQDGDLWLGAILHVLRPRLFFPNKPAISDSTRTMKFTGLTLAAESKGTSISIGYMGESYIDFGPLFMYVPIFILGWLYGWVYRIFSHLQGYEVLGITTAMSILMFSAHLVETSNIKLVGGVTVAVIVFGFTLRLWKTELWEMMCHKRASAGAFNR